MAVIGRKLTWGGYWTADYWTVTLVFIYTVISKLTNMNMISMFY